MKKKIMFDSNAFDKLFDYIERYEDNSDKYEFYITTIQVEELARIPDNKSEIRINNLINLTRIRPILVPTITVTGHSRVGDSILGSSESSIYNFLLNENKSNVNDALIGDSAKREECVLITDDKKFGIKLRKLNIETLTFEEFNNRL